MNVVGGEEEALEGSDLLSTFKLPATFLKVWGVWPLSAGRFVTHTEHLPAYVHL